MPSLSDLPKSIFRDFAQKLQETVFDHEYINGIFILSSGQSQPMIYSKTIRDFEKIKSMAELINSFNLEQLLVSLTAKGYHGTEILNFPEFSMGFIKLSDTEILAVLITSEASIADNAKVKAIVNDVKQKLFNTKAQKQMISMPNPQMLMTTKPESDPDDLNVPRPGA